MKNLTTRIPNYTQIYFPYSIVTSTCTRTVSIFLTLTYMQTRFRHQNKPFYVDFGMKYISKSIATLLFYQHTPIDSRFMKRSCVVTIKLNKLADVPSKWRWSGYLFTYVTTCEWGCVKDFEQRSHVYNAVGYNGFFPVDPDDRVIMESQCSRCITSMYHKQWSSQLI